ncbi:tigger transposable element-derived protein 1-like [Palaemon carinicauda]|uniref:tigger transposable element-derived protein 1-like n=1 Tax=Palaemon carinicauda TaxID=392227 RepID=UPI0035B69F53
MIISQKPSAIFADLMHAQAEDDAEGTSKQAPPKYKASWGWFEKFKRRSGVHSVVRHGEFASSDTKVAQAFVKTFYELTVQEGFSPQQVFNCNETGLFWKKIPLGKPLFRLDCEDIFGREANAPHKCLLVLDNARIHPPGLEDFILSDFSFIKVLYLPSNTTPLIQPMNQQVTSSFKKLYTKYLFKRCFEITDSTNVTLREFWKEHFDVVICLKIIDTAWREVSSAP